LFEKGRGYIPHYSKDKGRGYQIGKDEYLPVEDEELDSLVLESTKIIDLEKIRSAL
jgi:non-homologous end joining protein Ku